VSSGPVAGDHAERPQAVVRRVAWNTAAQAAGKAAVLAIGLASVIVTTRYLGSAGYGKVALAFAFIQMLGVLADVGLLTVVVREISRDPARTDRLVGNALLLRLALSLVTLLLAVLASLVLPWDREVRVAVLIAGVPFVLGLVNSALVAILQARLRMDRAAVADVLGRAASFAALVVAVTLDWGFYAVVATAAVGAAVTLAITWLVVRREAHPVPRAERAVWRSLLVAALPVGAALAVSEVFFRLDTLLVSAFRSYHEVGLYSLSYRIIELIAILPAIVMTSVFPLLSSYLRDSRDRAARTIDAAGDLFVAVGAPIAAGGLIVAPDLVRVLGGDEFAGAADPLRILLFAVALAFVSGLFGHSLIAGGRQAGALRLGLAALAFNLAANLVAIPAWGIEGAAAVALASEVLLVGGGLLLVRRELGLTPQFALLWRALVAAAVMAGVLALVSGWPLAVLLVLGVVLYATVLWALGGLDPRRLGALRA
jgi:O-antigen/teichoic acid export membrane protein